MAQTLENTRKDELKKKLCEVITSQYFDIEEASKAALLNDETEEERGAKNGIVKRFGDARLKKVFEDLQQRQEYIIEIARRFRVPASMICAIILKEQYTRSAPDWLSVTLKDMGMNNAGSTGLGAITAPTARRAYEYFGDERFFAFRTIPRDDIELLRLLSEDDELNIATIAAILNCEAASLGLLEGERYVDELSESSLHAVLAKYNGSEEYANKTIVYLPYFEEFLSIEQ